MMKKYIKYMASLLAVSFAMSACIDLEEMNVDPNNATTTNPSLLLTGVAYSAFNQTSSDANKESFSARPDCFQTL